MFMFFYIRSPGSAALEKTHAEDFLAVEVGDKGVVVADYQSQFVDIVRLGYAERLAYVHDRIMVFHILEYRSVVVIIVAKTCR